LIEKKKRLKKRLININELKLKRIYPKLTPVDIKKRIGKRLLWSIIPIEPLMEVLIIPATMLIEKLRKFESILLQ